MERIRLAVLNEDKRFKERKSEKEITVLINPNTVFCSQYGIISGHHWLRKEKERIEKNTGRECIVLRNRWGQEYLSYV